MLPLRDRRGCIWGSFSIGGRLQGWRSKSNCSFHTLASLWKNQSSLSQLGQTSVQGLELVGAYLHWAETFDEFLEARCFHYHWSSSWVKHLVTKLHNRQMVVRMKHTYEVRGLEVYKAKSLLTNTILDPRQLRICPKLFDFGARLELCNP